MSKIINFLTKFRLKSNQQMQNFIYSLCPHKWQQVIFDGYISYTCDICYKVSKDRK